ncbi:hypothetical protein NEOLEDRAFT_1172890, partial [Neolentinus lepideus HHB14362 ss-1]
MTVRIWSFPWLETMRTERNYKTSWGNRLQSFTSGSFGEIVALLQLGAGVVHHLAGMKGIAHKDSDFLLELNLNLQSPRTNFASCEISYEEFRHGLEARFRILLYMDLTCVIMAQATQCDMKLVLQDIYELRHITVPSLGYGWDGL